MATMVAEEVPQRGSTDVRTPFRYFVCRIGDFEGGGNIIDASTFVSMSVTSQFMGMPITLWNAGAATAPTYFPTNIIVDPDDSDVRILQVHLPEAYVTYSDVVEFCIYAESAINSDLNSVTFTAWDAPDIFPPELTGQVPANGATDIAPNASVEFTIQDVGINGVDISTVDIYVRENGGAWIQVLAGGAVWMNDFFGTVTALGGFTYGITFDRPVTSPYWTRHALVEVRVDSSDLGGTVLDDDTDQGYGLGGYGRRESYGSLYPEIDTFVVNSGTETFGFTVKDATYIQSANLISEFSFVLNFSEGMTLNTALESKASYTLVPLGATQTPLGVRHVYAQKNVIYPTGVVIETTISQTRGYYLVQVASGVVDQWGDSLGVHAEGDLVPHTSYTALYLGDGDMTSTATPWTRLSSDPTAIFSNRVATPVEEAAALGAGGARDDIWTVDSTSIIAGQSVISEYLALSGIINSNRLVIEANMRAVHDGPTLLGHLGFYDGSKLICVVADQNDLLLLGTALTVPAVVWTDFHQIRLVSEGAGMYVYVYFDNMTTPAITVEYNSIVNTAPTYIPLYNLDYDPMFIFVPQGVATAPFGGGGRQVEIDYVHLLTEDIILGNEATLHTWRTKVDSHDQTLPAKYGRRKNSFVARILASLGIADDDIGGDFGWWEAR